MQITDREPVRVFEGHVLRGLQENLHGSLVTPHHPEYEQARRIWNGYINRYPALIVRCVDAGDVAHAIRFARSHDLQIAVRGGGHSFPGYSSIDNGLVIDLSLMNDVIVDAERRTALASAGVNLGELISATEQFGLVTPVGTASDTGIAGLTLGGGFGFLIGKYGLACDNVLSYTLVTAEGAVLRVSATENPDLFWGLRGGGGNFGVVTAFEYQLHPLAGVWAGPLVHPQSKTGEVMRFYREACAQENDDLTIFLSLGTGPDGQPTITMIPCYSGDMQDGERILAPLRKFGPPLLDLVRPMRYQDLIAINDVTFDNGGNFYDKGCTLRELSDEAIARTGEAAASRTSSKSFIAFQPMHGAFTRVPVETTAYPLRSKNLMPVIVATWNDGPAEPHIQWARNTYASYKPYTIDETYVNFISSEEQSIVPAVYGGNYERLRELKRCYDPENVFRLNANIKP